MHGSCLLAFAAFGKVIEEGIHLPITYLYELQVRDGERRQGHGRRLVDEVACAARCMSTHSVLLTVHVANADARGFYSACQFVPAAISPEEVWPERVGTEEDTYRILQRFNCPAARRLAIRIYESRVSRRIRITAVR